MYASNINGFMVLPVRARISGQRMGQDGLKLGLGRVLSMHYVLFVWKSVKICCGDCRSDRGYLNIGIDGRTYRAHRLVWLYMTSAWPSGGLDHINRDRSDNRFANLRLATGSQNQANTVASVANTSGIKGASWDRARGKWLADIRIDGRLKKLGRFADKAHAAQAYAAAARTVHGEFARVA
jgi:hypothetical protein